MLNIVIPMAGAGSRFATVGFIDPKPLIQINGTPMIKLVIDNLRPLRNHRFIFICQNTHINDYNLNDKLRLWSENSEIIGIDGVTEGAACTVLKAKALINNDMPLMIANSDQYIDCAIEKYLVQMEQNCFDGLIMTMTANDPKWSFVRKSKANLVTHVAEKQVISNEATVGIYNFRRGRDFVSAAERMISLGQRTNGEYYVAPTYNVLIEERMRIGSYNVGTEGDGMHGLGTPSDLKMFLTRSSVTKYSPTMKS